MKRRSFIRRFSIGLASISGALLGFSFLKQLSFRSVKKVQRIKLGSISDFPVDTYTFIKNSNVYVYRDHEVVKAVSAVCTHLGCTVESTENGFECPCHGSCYSKEGNVLSGPAPTSLSWYKLEQDASGTIILDLNKEVDALESLYFS